MIFRKLALEGAYAVDLEKQEDERGFFARLFSADSFSELGLSSSWVQVNNSFSRNRGTVRGLHFQKPPVAEAKLVRCIKGAICDAIVDLRARSQTYGKWQKLELTEENRTMMYVPEGFAHGFQTLARDTELLYFHSANYSSDHESGLHYADQQLGIEWPLPVTEVSQRDRNFPGLSDLEPIQL